MKKLIIIFTLLFFTFQTIAQISPPGLGHSEMPSWFAAGIRNRLDSKWESMSYLGIGFKDITAINSNKNPAILVLNQEFIRQLKNNWNYSLALSLRNQKQQISSTNQTLDQQEIRLYGRLSHAFKFSKLKLTPTFRQELRKFFSPKSLIDSESLALRSRLRLQLSINLNEDASKKIIISSEQLFSAEKNELSKNWSDLKYKESRFLIYYSVTPRKSNITFDIGYMNNLVGGNNPYTVNYLSLDLIFNYRKKN